MADATDWTLVEVSSEAAATMVASPPRGEEYLSLRHGLHQSQRIDEEVDSAKIPGLQRQQHPVFHSANSPQHGNAGCDFRADHKAGDRQPIDHRAGGLAAGNYQPPHAGLHQSFGDIRHRLLDRVAGSVAAMARLKGCDLFRR